jgi:hypothetical protein
MKQLQILVCTLGWGMVSCNADKLPECFMPAGPAIEQEIQVAGGFHTLALFDDIHLEVHPGPENPWQDNQYNPGPEYPGQDNSGHGSPGQDNRLVLQGGKNLLERIDIRLQDSIISIRNRNRCNWMRDLGEKITLRLYARSIRNIQYSGSGDVVFADTLFQDHFTLEVWDGYGQVSPLIRAREASFKLHSGTATLTPAGRVEKADIWAASHGRFDGRGLQIRNAYIQHLSGNHAYVWAEDSLLVRLLSAGNLYFRGHPSVRLIEHTGSGGLYPFP